jgi:hypothetical protein
LATGQVQGSGKIRFYARGYCIPPQKIIVIFRGVFLSYENHKKICPFTQYRNIKFPGSENPGKKITGNHEGFAPFNLFSDFPKKIFSFTEIV